MFFPLLLLFFSCFVSSFLISFITSTLFLPLFYILSSLCSLLPISYLFPCPSPSSLLPLILILLSLIPPFLTLSSVLHWPSVNSFHHSFPSSHPLFQFTLLLLYYFTCLMFVFAVLSLSRLTERIPCDWRTWFVGGGKGEHFIQKKGPKKQKP